MPETNEQAVNPTESAPVENVVETPAETTPQEQPAQETQTTEQQAPAVAQPQVIEAVDGFGVPYKNRAFEWKRKSEELAEKLPTMIEEKLTQVLKQQGGTGQQKYTIEELEAFASQPDQNPLNANWARGEIRRLEREAQAEVVRGEIGKWQAQQEANVRRQQSFNYVATVYPDAFLKDAQGRVTGQFDNNNPMVQQMGVIMQDPRFANAPDGLVAAADIAYARLSRMQLPKIQQQQQQLKAENKNLQKKTLVEGGGGQPVQGVPAHRTAIDKLKQTGSMKDAQAALEAILKARSASQENE